MLRIYYVSIYIVTNLYTPVQYHLYCQRKFIISFRNKIFLLVLTLRYIRKLFVEREY